MVKWLSLAGVLAALIVAGLGTQPSAAAASSGGFVDLGPQSTLGNVIAVNASGEVATQNGFWHNGTFVTPGPVAGGGPMTITDMGPNGIVIGFSSRMPFGGEHMVAWNPVAGTAPAFVPDFPGAGPPLGSNGCGGGDDLAYAVSSSNEVGGAGAFNPQPPSGCNATYDHIGFTARTDGSNVAQTPSVPSVTALSDGWAVGGDNQFAHPGGGTHLLNRTSATVTSLGVQTEGPHAVSRDGVVVGQDLNMINNGAVQADYQAPGASATALLMPAGAAQGDAYAINDSNEIVGGAQNPGEALLWRSPSSAPVLLTSLLPPGWSADAEQNAIDNSGDVAAEATSPSSTSEDVMFNVGSPTDLTANVTLAGPNGAPFTGRAAARGSTVVATVTLTASPTAMAPITGIVANPPLAISPASSLTPVSGPSPVPPGGGYTLKPGASISYTMTYTVSGSGAATLSVSATGTENGAPESATAQVIARLGAPLGVSVAFSQNGVALPNNSIRLADTDAGEVPQNVDVKVTITNVSGVEQDNVSLNGIPALSYHLAADARQALPVGVTSGPTPGGLIGTMPAGANAVVTYALQVINNGVFDFSPQLLSSDAGTSGTNVSQGVGTLTALPTALLWLSLKPVSTDLVQAGTDVRVIGTVTNRSLTQSLNVDPFEPALSGNAGGGALHNLSDAPLPDGVYLPLSGKVQPGQTIDVEGVVSTAYVPGTRAELTYSPGGAVINPDATETRLTPSQVGMSAGSSPVKIGIDGRDAVVPAVTASTLFHGFTDAAIKGTSQWALNGLQAGADLLRHPLTAGGAIVKGIASFAVHGAGAVRDAASLVGAMYVLAVGSESMTAQERGAFADQIVKDFEASDLGVAHQALSDAADRVLPTFANALQTGDYNKVAALSGGAFATGLTTAEEALLGDIAFQKLALGIKYTGKAAVAAATGEISRAIVLGDAIRDAKVASVLGKGIEGVEAGTNLLADHGALLQKAFGLTTKQIIELRNYCQRSKIIIAVRSRSAKAAELIKKGLAVAKNEALKIKGVNSYDIDYLGYSKHDLNTVVWAQPVSREFVDAQLAGASREVREIVEERYATRVKEWKDAKIKKVIDHGKETGTIDWGFNGTDNGAPGANRSGTRRFALKDQPSPVKGHHDRVYQQVLVGSKDGLVRGSRLVPVTQDVDLMAILSASGEILSAEERTAAYIHLSDILGIEHPETPSWIHNGEIMFNAKAKQLADVVPGGEPLAVFSPVGGATVGFFDPALTIFDTVTKGGRIFFKGGYNNPYSQLKIASLLALRGRI